MPEDNYWKSIGLSIQSHRNCRYIIIPLGQEALDSLLVKFRNLLMKSFAHNLLHFCIRMQ